MLTSWRLRAVGWAAVLVVVLIDYCEGGYIITTAQEWVVGAPAQVCVDVDDPSAPAGYLSVSVKRRYYYGSDPDENLTLQDVTIPIPAGSTYFCEDIQMPDKHYWLKLWIRGQVAGAHLNRTMELDTKDRLRKTFIQTDKYLYQPNQKVQIRILTMYLTNFTVSTHPYSEVWVTTPSRTRIAQWNNVNNTAGLVHLDMTLADEPEQGRYKIHAKGHDGIHHGNHFEVKEYTVPRFEVTVKTPKTLFSSDHSFTVKVCARYTYGQPVKGSLTLEVDNRRYMQCWVARNITRSTINGCVNIEITAAALRVIDCTVERMQLKAMVTEGGTGVMQKGKAEVPVIRHSVTFKKIYQDTFKKHGLPYNIKVRAEKPDGTPAAGEPVEMCKGDMCFNFTVPKDGMIVTTAGKNEFKSIRMKALNTRVMLRESTFTTNIKRYYSPSNSSLLIYTPDEKLKCVEGVQGFEYLLPVFFVSDLPRASFTVQIITKHYIQYYTKTEEYALTPEELPIRPDEQVEPLEEPPLGTIRGVVNIPITLNSSISPSARVIVWVVRPDGEVVSDAKDLEMERCLPIKAEVAWSEAQAEPGQEVEMLITSAPNSLCSLGVVDKGTLLLDTRTRSLTLENIFSPLDYGRFGPWSDPQYDDVEYCRDQLGFNDDEFAGEYFTRYYDALGLLTGAGLYVLSDLVLETRPCEKRPWNVMPHYPMLALDYDMTRTVIDYQEEGKTRSHFPETWLWDLYVLPDSGIYSDHVTLPDTITEWVGQAVCVHPQKGFGLSQLTNITTFTPFFLDLTLPPSMKRGETLGVLVSIFNYLETSLPVMIQVHSSPEYEIIKDPSSQQPEGVVEACVAGDSKVVLEIKIKPTALGEVNITVEASVDQQSNNECGTPAPKVTRRDTLVKPITVKAEGFLREKTWNKYICTKDLADKSDSLERWSIEAPGGIVEGSDRGWVTVVGSLLSISLENLGHLIRMPYGCGEQNMINFAPNVFILQYLRITRQSTPEAVTKLTRFMNIGYQRQLLYMRENGSYSAFGNADPSGSTWLTAFVVKSLAQAQLFITVDSDSLKHSMDWLKGTQASNGCFLPIGQVFNKALKGGLDGKSSETLTSYVLVSLMEAGEESTSSVVLNATFCLLSLPTPSHVSYSLALRAYALALVGVPEAEEALKSLMAQAVVTSNSTHWEIPSHYGGRSDALYVETAGYAVLAMMTFDPEGYKEPVRKVVKWITAQRNGQGGFYTTQDTVVALQALAKYESTQYQEDVDLVATIKGTGIDHSFAVSEDNKLVTQRAPIHSLPTSLTLTMVGQGCAVFQSVLRYNVFEPDSSDTFSLAINTQTAVDRTCTTKWINACATYHLPRTSNMAVVAIDLVSGYVPLKDDLKKIIKFSPRLVKKYEVDGSQVMFYIEEFGDRQEVCLRMRVTRLVDVEDAKPGSVTVYDYYQPEFSVSKTYTLPPNDECNYST